MKMLIISDIHANLAALEAVLDAEPDVDQTVCLGDLVDYGPQPAACIDLIWEYAQVVIQGNHDYAVGNESDPRCSPAYRHLARVTRDFSIRALDEEQQNDLADLPLSAHFEYGGKQFFAVHAAPSDPLFAYLPPDTPDGIWTSQISMAHRPDFLLMGHTHLPLMRQMNGTILVNPGSVGQPKTGDPRADYAVYQDGAVSLRQVAYDWGATADAYTATDLKTYDIARLIAIIRSGGAEGP